MGLDFDFKEKSLKKRKVLNWNSCPKPLYHVVMWKEQLCKWSSKVIKHEKYYFSVSIHNCQSTWKLTDIDLLPWRITKVVHTFTSWFLNSSTYRPLANFKTSLFHTHRFFFNSILQASLFSRSFPLRPEKSLFFLLCFNSEQKKLASFEK